MQLDQRIVSGIIHKLQSGARWRDCPLEYGPDTTTTIASIAGPSEDDGAQSSKRWPSLAKTASCCRSTRPRLILTGVPPAEKGEHNQAIGRSRGGRTTTIRALSDPVCRPVVLHLTPGQEADIAAAPDLVALALPMSALLADKGYDGDKLRGEIIRRVAKPVIPNKSNRVVIHRFNKRAYKGRNVIERCFCRLKDFRRIATRYDKLARNFLAAVHLAALVVYWLN
ncbi:transposase [Bradyrhizobium sp. i1.15.2]